MLFSGNKTTANPSATPVNATPAENNLLPAISTSPARNSPSKLPAFLRYAEDHLGIKHSMDYKYLLANKGYGPDVLPYVEDKEIVLCGVTAGDAIRLKRGAAQWWNSPEAKQPRLQDNATAPSADDEDFRRHIRFEKRYTNNNGSVSVFGPGMVPGKNWREKEFVWWYFSDMTRKLERVPEGLIPEIDQQYLDPNAPPFEPSPSPEC